MPTFGHLLNEVRNCDICTSDLPLEPRPVLQLHPNAKVLIADQAPGKKVHFSGVPFDDPSGKRLRQWMGVTTEVFYNPMQIAILPMGFYFPGSGRSGDLPPRPECEPAWRKQLLGHLDQIQITVVLGQYAQAYHFDNKSLTVTELVRSWRNYWPLLIPLPHPSPRNNIWLRRNPWFEDEVVPALKQRIEEVLTQ